MLHYRRLMTNYQHGHGTGVGERFTVLMFLEASVVWGKAVADPASVLWGKVCFIDFLWSNAGS